MLALRRLTLRGLVAVAALAGTTATVKAQIQPQARPNLPWNHPLNQQFQNPNFPWQKQPAQQAGQPRNTVVAMPSINTLPGIPASTIFRPVMDVPSWLNPALNNPWMNQTVVTPVRVPFQMNPMFNNPFALNPLLQRAWWLNQMNVPGFVPQTSLSELVPGPLTPGVSVTPPVAVQQPGLLIYKGPDLQVNATSGTVYRPQSGVVTLADGSKFYRVPGSGLPTAVGTYATGTGLYYNPDGNTFFNPSSGVISKPGTTNVFLPYVW
jgi:hypothetical protein